MKTTDKMKNTKDIGIDLFEDYTNIPAKVQTILDKYEDAFVDGDYKQLEKANKELNKIGYTFEYYLDGQAYDLRPVGTKGKSEMDEFRKGGGITLESGVKKYGNELQINKKEAGVNIRKILEKYIKEGYNFAPEKRTDAIIYLVKGSRGSYTPFGKGGSLDKENSDMVLNNNKQISHHTKELANAVNKNKNIPAWVVAKVNRSATDISDATHYLEGAKYKKGGNLEFCYSIGGL
jgi:ribosomal protein L39E